MANITVRRDNESRTLAPQIPLWEPRYEPFRMMRELMGWDPFREMTAFPLTATSSFAPAFEIKETRDGYTFKADVPGVREQDLDITLTGNRLTVSGKRESDKIEQTDTYYAAERNYGSFFRSFTLPEGIDANSMHADVRDGVLSLSVRKVPEALPRHIPVGSAPARKG
jgi:HSP20 family protein